MAFSIRSICRPVRMSLALATLTLGATHAQVMAAEVDEPVPQSPIYESRTPSRDGIGKVYMGREISRVMGHLGAGWLERPGRQREERTDLLLDNLPLKPGAVVADIGAGTGFFTLPLAQRVGPSGQVLAVDIQPEMLAIIERRRQDAGLDNIDLITASETDPKLPPGTVDLVLMVDAYHEFSYPREVMTGIVQSLAPGGTVVLIEYRAEDPRVPIKRLHKMTAAQATFEMAAVGLTLEANLTILPQQHFMIFRIE